MATREQSGWPHRGWGQDGGHPRLQTCSRSRTWTCKRLGVSGRTDGGFGSGIYREKGPLTHMLGRNGAVRRRWAAEPWGQKACALEGQCGGTTREWGPSYVPRCAGGLGPLLL